MKFSTNHLFFVALLSFSLNICAMDEEESKHLKPIPRFKSPVPYLSPIPRSLLKLEAHLDSINHNNALSQEDKERTFFAGDLPEGMHDALAVLARFKDLEKKGLMVRHHYVMQGAPGNGKTSLARTLGQVLGVTPSNIACTKIIADGLQQFKHQTSLEGYTQLLLHQHLASMLEDRLRFINPSDPRYKSATHVIILNGLNNLIPPLSFHLILKRISRFIKDARARGCDLFVVSELNQISDEEKRMIDADHHTKTIKLSLPNSESRLKILKHLLEQHKGDITLDPEINLKALAQDSPECTGAVLRKIIEDGLTFAALEGTTLRQEHLIKALISNK